MTFRGQAVYTTKKLQDDINLASSMMQEFGIHRRYTFARQGGVLYSLREAVGMFPNKEVEGGVVYSDWQEIGRGSTLTIGLALWRNVSMHVTAYAQRTLKEHQALLDKQGKDEVE